MTLKHSTTIHCPVQTYYDMCLLIHVTWTMWQDLLPVKQFIQTTFQSLFTKLLVYGRTLLLEFHLFLLQLFYSELHWKVGQWRVISWKGCFWEALRCIIKVWKTSLAMLCISEQQYNDLEVQCNSVQLRGGGWQSCSNYANILFFSTCCNLSPNLLPI